METQTQLDRLDPPTIKRTGTMAPKPPEGISPPVAKGSGCFWGYIVLIMVLIAICWFIGW